MDFSQLFKIGTEALQLFSQFRENYEAVKLTLNTTEQEQLDEILEKIHQENMKLSSAIDGAAAEAEKRS